MADEKPYVDYLDERDEYAEGLDDDGNAEFDCHMGRAGDCGLAGTEECDFECPYRNVKRN